MSTIKADTLSNLAGSQTVPVSTVAQGSAKAWVNFNGTGTVAIRASFNVSSITDNGTGQYTVNFTNAMVDANYATVSAAGIDISNKQTTAIGTQNTTNVTVFMYNGAATLVDSNYVTATIFR